MNNILADHLGFATVILAFCLGIGGCSYMIGSIGYQCEEINKEHEHE